MLLQGDFGEDAGDANAEIGITDNCNPCVAEIASAEFGGYFEELPGDYTDAAADGAGIQGDFDFD